MPMTLTPSQQAMMQDDTWVPAFEKAKREVTADASTPEKNNRKYFEEQQLFVEEQIAELERQKEELRDKENTHEIDLYQQQMLAALATYQALQERIEEPEEELTHAADAPLPNQEQASVAVMTSPSDDAPANKDPLRFLTKKQFDKFNSLFEDFQKTPEGKDLKGTLYHCKDAADVAKLPEYVREKFEAEGIKPPFSVFVMSGPAEQFQAFQRFVANKDLNLAKAAFGDVPAPSPSKKAAADNVPAPQPTQKPELPASSRVTEVREAAGIKAAPAAAQRDDDNAPAISPISPLSTRPAGPGM